MIKLFIFMIGMFCNVQDVCAASIHGLDGTGLSLLWTLPFLGVLLSLAVIPVFAHDFWEQNMGKISLVWSGVSLVMLLSNVGFNITMHVVLETYLHHFIPFMVFILSLYVICGGIKIKIDVAATPMFNVIFMLCATLLASLIGTTGAAMLFIRPLLYINDTRQNKSYLVIFFIFLVCNIGGSLSAIGDPPLFLGFLNGIDFFWATVHLFKPFVLMSVPLFILLYCFDSYYFRQEKHDHKLHTIPKVTIYGRSNVMILIVAVSIIILSGIFPYPDKVLCIANVNVSYTSIIRDLSLLLLTIISVKWCNKDVRHNNHFSWEPFFEVCKVFAAIFITAAPVIAMLKSGENGAFANLVTLVNDKTGPNNMLYFWITGVLSSFLDNAPTYLVFFNLAGGDPELLSHSLSNTLVAISCGAVFMGAMTYIGNAPNLMVKSIAQRRNVQMPGFFGYLLWSICILLPVLILVSMLCI